ncbi:MFS transporter [Paractinoplanes brasiliensis]|uniref:Na+/melibiose symporter-like transporter n=1 Tax=Paractinoplanes brasiliensis TaxID=52695 RepID=A0A4R6JM06_9ACTN|nr:MFS transporter [Actinoplanes brasiliensis]TDO37413.1 Na+/melibiose symporter-like transporter [Actinoplanes brasiliensis]GID29271.1 MFS transporter [Actinoplanes brasiliensis]
MWLLLIGELIMALGIGMTQPYAVVLLHDIRGYSLAVATGIWALGPIVTIAGNAVAGPLIDRRGGRFVMVIGIVLVGISLLALAYGPGLASAMGSVMIGGLGFSFALPALATRLAILTPEKLRARVFTTEYVIMNLGMAIGAAVGGVAFAVWPPDTETGKSVLPMLWVAAAALSVVYIVVTVLAGRQMAPPSDDTDAMSKGGYRRALGNRTLVRILVAAALLSTLGYGIYNAAPSVMALAAADPAALGWAGVANSLAIVVGAPVALRLADRISARSALLCTAGLWGLAWAICVPTVLGGGLGTRAALTVASVLIGFGELLIAGALPTLINGMAPDDLRGRYNALSNLALTVGMAAGPLLTSASAVVDSTVSLLYVAVALAAVASLLLLRRTSVAEAKADGPQS